MILTGDRMSSDEFRKSTGWQLKPEGACKGDVCVPLPDGAVLAGVVDVALMAQHLGMPIVVDDESGMRAMGPESLGGRALTTAVAPELMLPDFEGRPFELSSLRGQKVVLVAWAPY